MSIIDTPTTVLVIDDDPIAIEVVTGHLTHAQIATIPASSVDEALALLENGPLPDVIVSDVMMPERDGFDLCRHIRSDERLLHVPIVFVTALGDRDARIRALDDGADDLLAKPVDDVELVARVRSLSALSRTRYRRQQQERFDAVLASVADGIVVVDLAGSIVEANAAARRLLGVEPGQGLEDAWERTGFGEPDALATQGHDDHVGVLRLRPRAGNGSELWVRDVATTVLDGRGRPEATLHVLRDVTDEQRARRASRLVLNSITHKFRTPLTGLSGALELLQRTDPTAMQQQILDIMQSSLQRLESTVVRVVESAESAAAAQRGDVIELEESSIVVALGELVPDHKDIVGGARIDLRGMFVAPSAVLSVTLIELLDNAVQAAATGAAGVDLSIIEDDAGLTIIVEDDGPGTPPEDHERQFAAFFQADRTGQAPGMGLGLALVRHVVEEAGGSISADGFVDGKTRFTARIPLASAA